MLDPEFIEKIRKNKEKDNMSVAIKANALERKNGEEKK